MTNSGLLNLIWLTSAGLAVLSLLIMICLIVLRAVGDVMKRRNTRLQKALLDRLLDFVVDPRAMSGAAFCFSLSEKRILSNVIETLLRSVDGADRDRLIEFIRMIGGVDEKLELLRQGNKWTRSAAARGLRHFHEPRVVEALHNALDDRSALVREAAGQALVELGAVRSAGYLIRKLVDESSVSKQSLGAIFTSLAQHHSGELIAVARSGSLAARLVAINALAHSGDLRIVDDLIALMPSGSKEIRASILKSLSDLGDSRALPAVVSGLRDPAWEVRTQAARCAGRIHAGELAMQLIQLLYDPVWWVRYRSAEAVYEMGERGRALLNGVSGLPSRAGEAAKFVLAEKIA